MRPSLHLRPIFPIFGFALDTSARQKRTGVCFACGFRYFRGLRKRNIPLNSYFAMRYFIELCYDGGRYCGWQRQRDAPSVQATLEAALSTLLREPIEVTGAGRTDTGVHAAYYVAHFDTAATLADPLRTVYKLNCLLPSDIAVFGVTRVADDAHARFSAAEREYRYFIETRKNPFTRQAAWHYCRPLDAERMNRAAALLTEYCDFTSFAKLNSDNRTNLCRIVRAGWEESSEGVYRFTIRADRFLRNMVRALVGTLVDVGRGRYGVEEFRAIVASRDLSRASGSAPARGLYLWDVAYPAEVFRRGACTRNPLFNY